MRSISSSPSSYVSVISVKTSLDLVQLWIFQPNFRDSAKGIDIAAPRQYSRCQYKKQPTPQEWYT